MIPKIIHHIAPEDKKKWHPVWDRCYPTWLQHFPESEYKHMMWADDRSLDRLVIGEFPHYMSNFVPLKHIQKIDIAKLVMLYKYGGLYTDMDYFCRSNFFDDFKNKVILSGSPHKQETLQNGLIAAEPRHPFILQHIEDIFVNIRNVRDIKDDMSHHDHVQATTGPFALDKSYFRNKQYWVDIQVLDYKTYNPLVTAFYHKNEMTGVKCIHLLTGWWGKETRKEKRVARRQYEDWRKIQIGDL